MRDFIAVHGWINGFAMHITTVAGGSLWLREGFWPPAAILLAGSICYGTWQVVAVRREANNEWARAWCEAWMDRDLDVEGSWARWFEGPRRRATGVYGYGVVQRRTGSRVAVLVHEAEPGEWDLWLTSSTLDWRLVEVAITRAELLGKLSRVRAHVVRGGALPRVLNGHLPVGVPS